MKQKYIEALEKKYSLKFVRQMEGDILSFEEDRFPAKKLFFEMDDIVFDIDHNIKKGFLMLYANEGTDNGKMPDYRTWLANNFEGE